MTIIVGYLYPGDGAIIATDSQITIGEHCETIESKVKQLRGLHVGISGPARSLDVVESALAEALGDRDQVTTVVLARELSLAFERVGWEAEKERGRPAYRDFAAVVTDGRRLFEADVYLHFRELAPKMYTAIGCHEYAYGAFHALADEDPETVLRRAVEATCHYDTSCCLPVKIHAVEPAEVTII